MGTVASIVASPKALICLPVQSSNSRMHIKKIVAGAGLLVLPILAVFSHSMMYFTYCYDLAGNRLPTADGMYSTIGGSSCGNYILGISQYLIIFLPAVVGGVWLLVYGLAGRSLISGKKESELRSPSYGARIIGGTALIGASIPFMYLPLKEVIYFCQFPDSVVCSMELNTLLITVSVIVPLVLGDVWLIFSSIRKMYPISYKNTE